MRCYKYDMMTVLVVLATLGIITATSTQAQEISNIRSLYMTKTSIRCIDIPSSNTACMLGNEMIAGITHAPSYTANNPWQSHRLFTEEAVISTSLFVSGDRDCKMSQDSTQSSINAEFSDFKIGLSQYLTFDFEMDDVSRLEISSIYFGFKNCW